MRYNKPSTLNAPATTLDSVERIQNTVEGLPHECFNYLFNRVMPGCKANVLVICDYISSLKSEINPSNNYQRDSIILLCKLSVFFKNDKTYKEMTREDLLSFLDSFRKVEAVDPLHKWIGTHNLYRIHLMRFLSGCTFRILNTGKDQNLTL
jgi:hypothetical protein